MAWHVHDHAFIQAGVSYMHLTDSVSGWTLKASQVAITEYAAQM